MEFNHESIKATEWEPTISQHEGFTLPVLISSKASTFFLTFSLRTQLCSICCSFFIGSNNIKLMARLAKPGFPSLEGFPRSGVGWSNAGIHRARGKMTEILLKRADGREIPWVYREQPNMVFPRGREKLTFSMDKRRCQTCPKEKRVIQDILFHLLSQIA